MRMAAGRRAFVTSVCLAGLAAAGAVGAVAAAQPASADPALKDPMRGLVDRHGPSPYEPERQRPPEDADYRAAVPGFVVDIDWSVLQPDGPDQALLLECDDPDAEGPLPKPCAHDKTGRTLGELLDLAEAENLRLRLRVKAGVRAPDWAKRLCDDAEPCEPIPWSDPQSSGECADESCTIPYFWSDAFAQAYEQLQEKLAAVVEPDPRVPEVTVTMCTTVFAEPLIRQLASPLNAQRLAEAGFTVEADERCNRTSIAIHARVWVTTRSVLNVNPYQQLVWDGTAWTKLDEVPNTDPADTSTFTNRVMRACRDVLGGRCVLGNHSIHDTRDECGPFICSAATATSGYGALYALMQRHGPPIAWQTARPAVIDDWKLTLEKALAYGGNSIELPGSPNGYTCWVVEDDDTPYGIDDEVQYCGTDHAADVAGRYDAIGVLQGIHARLVAQPVDGPSIPPVPPSVTLAADAPTVVPGGRVTLTWDAHSPGATCTAAGAWSGPQGPAGSAVVSPSAPGPLTFLLSCIDAVGTGSASVTITVAPLPDVRLVSSRASILLGERVTLSWTSTDATACTASGAWSGSRPLDGTRTVTPSTVGAVRYSLTCTSPYGSARDGVTVTVTVPEITSFGYRPRPIPRRGPGFLVWETTSMDPNSCRISTGGSTIAKGLPTSSSGWEIPKVHLDDGRRFTLSCTSGSDRYSKRATIAVG